MKLWYTFCNYLVVESINNQNDFNKSIRFLPTISHPHHLSFDMLWTSCKIPTIKFTQTFHLLMFIWYQLKNYRHSATAHVRRLRKWRYFNSLRFRERPRYPINSFVAGQNCKHGATNIWTTSLKTNSCANATSKIFFEVSECAFRLQFLSQFYR